MGTQLFDVVDLNVGVAWIAFVMVLLLVCYDRRVVVSQNSGVKKPPAISGRFVRTVVA
ncbi:hypothetical protein METHPM2_110024 [Pseudomonas sp. PM2]